MGAVHSGYDRSGMRRRQDERSPSCLRGMDTYGKQSGKLISFSYRPSTLLCLLAVFMSLQYSEGRIYNDPPYDWEYLQDDCQPFFDNETGEAWNKSVKNLTDGVSRLYGFVQPTPTDVYWGPANCAIKVVAPPGYNLVVRIPRVEIYDSETGCSNDYMSVMGATDELKYCGYGTVTHSIHSTANWLIFRLMASVTDPNHDDIGFILYYTAVHYGSCDDEGENATEWRCKSMASCTPEEVVCDTKDNCGLWDDETSNVCGLTNSAIIAITVVSVLVGGTIIFFTGYCLYSQQKEKKARERRQRQVIPTLNVGYQANSGQLTIIPTTPSYASNGALAELPPPYVLEAFRNMACNVEEDTDNYYCSINQITDSAPQANVSPPTAPTDENVTVGGLAVAVRPAIGEPPPVYSPQTGAEGQKQVGFDALPEKPDS